LSLSGAGVRIARRLGLHRDGAILGLPPFETEMRRRIWWTVKSIDARVAELCGARASLDLAGDTESPLNLNDTDIWPGMTEPPKERTESTGMIFCLIRCIMGKTFKELGSSLMPASSTQSITSLQGQKEAVQKYQETLEQRILRHCDPLEPLHFLASIVCRASICSLKVTIRHHMQLADNGTSMPQAERDILFENGTKVIEYVNLMHTSSLLYKFQYMLGPHFMWDSYFYTLYELRQRKPSREVDYIWAQIDQLFENIPKLMTESGNFLFSAVGNWTLKVWEEKFGPREVSGSLQPPEYINLLRYNKSKLDSGSTEISSATPTDPATLGQNVDGLDQHEILKPFTGQNMHHNFANLNSFEAPGPFSLCLISWTGHNLIF
jgi:hypothetical protein